MNLVRFLKDFFHVDGSGNTSVKYAQGQTYPVSEEGRSQVVAGTAEWVSETEATPVAQAEAPTQAAESPITTA